MTMIAHLSGIVLYKEPKSTIIQTNGVGYKVSMTERDLESLHISEPISVWVYTAVREDAIDLYGFIIKEAKETFDLLLTISGVGPKTALGILNVAGHEKIKEAVLTGEVSYLTSISGIGKKVAEKIILELKGKVFPSSTLDYTSSLSHQSHAVNQSDIDTIEALKSLGYTHKEAKEALEKLDTSTRSKDTSDKIKALLKTLM